MADISATFPNFVHDKIISQNKILQKEDSMFPNSQQIYSSNSIVESLVKTILQRWRSIIDYTFDLYIAKIVKTISTFDTDVVLYQ